MPGRSQRTLSLDAESIELAGRPTKRGETAQRVDLHRPAPRAPVGGQGRRQVASSRGDDEPGTSGLADEPVVAVRPGPEVLLAAGLPPAPSQT